MVNVGQDDFDSKFSALGNTGRTYEAKRYSETYEEVNAGPGGNSLTARLTAEAKAGQYSADQAAALAQGQQFRAGLNPSEQRYEAVPHGELKNMVTQDLDPQDIDEKGELWNNQGNSLNNFSNAVRDAIGKEGEHWQGDGAKSVTPTPPATARTSRPTGSPSPPPRRPPRRTPCPKRSPSTATPSTRMPSTSSRRGISRARWTRSATFRPSRSSRSRRISRPRR